MVLCMANEAKSIYLLFFLRGKPYDVGRNIETLRVSPEEQPKEPLT